MRLKSESAGVRPWSGLARAWGWESLQNLPLVAGLLLGLEAWRSEKWALAIGCMAAGSLLGALVIWATEARIVSGHREPVRVVLTNAAVMAVLEVVLVAYLSSAWSRWWTDLLAGGVGAVVLGIAQDLAAGSTGQEGGGRGIDWGHCAALALAFVCALLGIRVLVAFLPPAANLLVVTALTAGVVVLIDYRPVDEAEGG